MARPALWFTSDTHFGHAAILGFCSRPFATVQDMDRALAKAWNDRVGQSDIVYHLGDFALCSPAHAVDVLRGLNGRKRLVAGNHDRKLRSKPEFTAMFESVSDLERVEVEIAPSEKKLIVLCHYAMLTWEKSHFGSWHLHGHSHGGLPDDPRALRLDVGVDPRGYAPVSLSEIAALMAAKTWTSTAHPRRREDEE